MSGMNWNHNKPLSGLRSLLATDRQLTRELLITVLKAAGADQVMTGSAPEMLAAAPGFAPDVIFAEFDMVPINGNIFLHHLRFRQHCTMPSIILFHETDQQAALSGAKESGVTGALLIPFKPDSVIRMTRKVLGQKV